MAVENGRRMPDFLDVHGRIRTIHIPQAMRISREEYLAGVSAICVDEGEPTAVSESDREASSPRKIVSNVSPEAMSDAVFEIHLQNLS